MKNGNSKLCLILSFGAVGIAFIWLNSWNVLPCWDCAVRRGRPFAYKITEGFVTAPRILWPGLLADLALFCIATLLTFVALRFLSKELTARAR
jgi:hypothetical protein